MSDAAAGQARSVAVDPAQVTSILILQFRWLGDLVLGTSLIDNLQQHYPNAKLTLLSDPANADLLKLRPQVEFVAHRRRKRGSTNPFRALGGWIGSPAFVLSRRFDLVVDISNSKSGSFLTRLSRARVRVGLPSPEGFRKRSYTHVSPGWAPDTHYIDRFLSVLAPLGVPVARREPHLEASPAAHARVARWLEAHDSGPGRYVVVHLGARIAGRQWPLERFSAVIDALSSRHGLRAVLTGGADERGLAETVSATCASPPLNAVGVFAFDDLVALLASSRLFLGNDSGPMHIAAAAGARIVALFGMQSPEQWAPLGAGHAIVRPAMPCPCPFPEICQPPDPQKTLCVRRIGIEDVLAAAETVLQRGA